ncbi:MAG: hypothetical protein IID61_04140 [SAR324 cluster bacterium]|nr:hypothetical protein [SAR324 cluster bacterium]
MEKMGSGQTRKAVLQGVKSLLSILMENWGDPEGFKAAAVEPLSRALGGTGASTGTDPKNLEGLAEQVYLVTSQIRNLQIRHIDNHPDLLKAQKALEPAFAANPARQGSLWLAVRMRQEALSLLDTPEGKTTYGRIVNGLDEQRALVNKRFKETDQLTLDALETGVALIGASILGKGRNKFLIVTVAAEIVEKARKQARLHPSQTDVPADFSDNSPETRIVSALEEPARQAELTEARQRFSGLNDHQKGARYEALRKVMLKNISRIAPYAPHGFETFCLAVESIAFPYPAPLEWVRNFLKPLHANARQSTTFDKCRTEKSVNYRYQKIQEERGVNPVMLELARSFAMATLKTAQEETVKNFIVEVNLVGEFKWPADMDELKEHLQQ